MKKEIGMVVRDLRRQNNLKQDYIAYRLGITTQAYANIECGRSDINSRKLRELAKLFEVKVSDIIILAERNIDSISS